MDTCMICDCPLGYYRRSTTVLDCEHAFHLRCLYLKNAHKCPSCNQSFSRDDINVLTNAYKRQLYRIQESADSGYESI